MRYHKPSDILRPAIALTFGLFIGSAAASDRWPWGWLMTPMTAAVFLYSWHTRGLWTPGQPHKNEQP